MMITCSLLIPKGKHQAVHAILQMLSQIRLLTVPGKSGQGSFYDQNSHSSVPRYARECLQFHSETVSSIEQMGAHGTSVEQVCAHGTLTEVYLKKHQRGVTHRAHNTFTRNCKCYLPDACSRHGYRADGCSSHVDWEVSKGSRREA